MTDKAPEALSSCSAKCGDKVASPSAAGWSFLPITGGYRCGACERTLLQACYTEGGTAADNMDPLPRDSIGALKKLPEREPFKEGVRP